MKVDTDTEWFDVLAQCQSPIEVALANALMNRTKALGAGRYAFILKPQFKIQQDNRRFKLFDLAICVPVALVECDSKRHHAKDADIVADDVLKRAFGSSSIIKSKLALDEENGRLVSQVERLRKEIERLHAERQQPRQAISECSFCRAKPTMLVSSGQGTCICEKCAKACVETFADQSEAA